MPRAFGKLFTFVLALVFATSTPLSVSSGAQTDGPQYFHVHPDSDRPRHFHVQPDSFNFTVPDTTFLNESVADETAIDCGTTGKRFQVIYAIPSGNTANVNAVSHIRQDIATMDKALDREAGWNLNQHFRFVCDALGAVEVTVVNLSTSSNDFGTIESELDNTFNSADRKYLVWVEVTNEDLTCGGNVVSGCAIGRNEDETASTSNLNNTGGDMGGVAYKGATGRWGTAIHEAFHILGAVLQNAPWEDDNTNYPSNANHVYEGNDWVSNSDRVINCTRHTLDCNKNDYWSPFCAYNASGCTSWLKDKYNIAAHSLYLTSVTSESGTKPKCDGYTVTYTGTTEMPDNISLGSTDDVVDGREGWNNPTDDVIQEVLQVDGGNDRVCGDGGRDHIRGGSGQDRLFGEQGADIVRGSTGADYIDGGPGNDVLYDGDGLDDIRGGTGTDTLYQCSDGVSDSISSVENIISPSSTYC